MGDKLYSDNRHNVQVLAKHLFDKTSLDLPQSIKVAQLLLGRKKLKIKSSALAQIFLSLDKDIDTKAKRNELIKAHIIERIDGTGVEGRPAVYRIMPGAMLSDLEELSDDTPAIDFLDQDTEAPVSVEVEVEHVEVVSPKEDAHKGQGKEFEEWRAEGSRAKGLHASGEGHPFVSKVGRGAHFRREERRGDESSTPKESQAAVSDLSPSNKSLTEPIEVEGDIDTAPVEKSAAKSVADAPKAKVKAKRKHTKRAEQDPSSTVKDKERARSSREQAEGKDTSKKEKDARMPEGSHSCKKSATAEKNSRKVATDARETAGAQDLMRKVSVTALVRVVAKHIVHTGPVSKAIVKVQADAARTKDARVESPSQKRAPLAQQAPEKHKKPREVDTIADWVEHTLTAETPHVTRRQRAYEILGDEKAFDGKAGEKLFKRLNDRGINPTVLKITPSRSAHFMGFYGIGSNSPFVVVENLDAYEEIARLLRGKKSIRLFGQKIGGVIFGGGCKASVSHALDDYLSDIGYRFKFVYYAGDIDREGARIIEQTRNANVITIKMHVGMYKAMLAEHKKREKDGFEPEAAATLQGIPQNLATTIKDLPPVTRMQFRNVLRANYRIPQEILTTPLYRDSSSDAFERLLNA